MLLFPVSHMFFSHIKYFIKAIMSLYVQIKKEMQIRHIKLWAENHST